tara:strand:- start:717 stop:1370 length:654 start_codon:yes stop_codon:yes gene_type:complete
MGIVDDVNLTYLGHTVDNVDRTVYTFSSLSLGAAAVDRLIVLGVGNTAGWNITSITIGGVSTSEVATIDIEATSGNIWFHQAVVPTGTTGDIVVTFSGASERCGLQWWRLTGANTTATATASDSTGASGVYSTTINCESGGAILGLIQSWEDPGSGRTHTWSGITEETGSDEVIDSGNAHSAASDSFTSTQTGLAISATVSGAINKGGLLLAAYGPT